MEVVILVMGHFIFIFCLARMEFRLAVTSRDWSSVLIGCQLIGTGERERRLEGLTMLSLALATMAKPVMSSSPKNLIVDVEHTGINEHLRVHGNPSAIATDFSLTACGKSFDVIFGSAQSAACIA